jgi:uncharacterized protein YgbK (DUF1537 family)
LSAGNWLLCGSSGLAREVKLMTSVHRDKSAAKKDDNGAVLVVVGSRNDRSAEQLALAKERLGLPVLNLEVAGLRRARAAETVKNIVAEADILLRDGKGLVLSAASSHYVAGLKEIIPTVMAEAVAGILDLKKFTGVFLTGGDIAGAVCRRLSASAIEVQGEVAPGIPVGELVGGPWQGMGVGTKAGGFGSLEALVESITYLRERRAI